ncbi:hypothetical protein LIER_23726 [Lithospermum erythrorhizon]|uniref:RNase H type-1 domain-containing protein n=1 Tax=Lithospermum erythrorhizon TaxID=34254 RepID=A0AAV3R014_LITER
MYVDDLLPYSFSLSHNCSNNVAKYQALISGLEAATELDIHQLEVYGDSQLVINQLLGDYEVRKPEKMNKQADALAGLASSLTYPGVEIRVPVYWRPPLIDYLQYGRLPEDPQKKVDITMRAPRFLYYNGTLFRRSFGEVLLRCLSDTEAAQAMNEAHSGICRAHQSGAKLHFQIKRMGYYWPTMFHANIVHQPLHPTTASWPFNSWGMDMVEQCPNQQKDTSTSLRLRIISLSGQKSIFQQDPLQYPKEAIPYSLVYGVEVVLPLEVQIPTKGRTYQRSLLKEYYP